MKDLLSFLLAIFIIAAFSKFEFSNETKNISENRNLKYEIIDKDISKLAFLLLEEHEKSFTKTF